MKKRTLEDFYRNMSKVELRVAQETKERIADYLVGHTVADVAKFIGVPKYLVKKAKSDDVGVLVDFVNWQRRQRKTEQ